MAMNLKGENQTMKQLKKWLGLALCLAMLVTLLPRLSLTAHAQVLSGVCGADGNGSNMTWTYDSDESTLTIAGTGNMRDYEDEWDSPWNQYAGSVTKLVISDGVNGIGAYAFAEFDAITEVTIPDSVTSINSCAFLECDNLSSVTIGSGLETLGINTFHSPNLAGFTVSSENQNFTNDSSGVLYNKEKTVLYKCPGKFQGSYTVADGVDCICSFAFAGNSGLTSVIMPDTVTTVLEYAFNSCAGLTSVKISNNITVINLGVFSFCSSLKEVKLPDSLTTIGMNAFWGCQSLTRVKVPESVTEIGMEAIGYGFLNDGWSTIDVLPGFTIYGCAGSAAEDYAKENGITFVRMDPTSGFCDVSPKAYYYQPMLWALEEGITSGTSDVTFGPKKTCTRAEVVTFLWNANGKPEPDTDDNPFLDVKPGKYYYKSALWAYQTGVTKGADETHFMPNSKCSRAQVVSFLWNSEGKPEPTSTDNPFMDVKESKYYYKAVLWAVENGITKGVDTTHFGPNQTCTRGQVVTFLYNALGK